MAYRRSTRKTSRRPARRATASRKSARVATGRRGRRTAGRAQTVRIVVEQPGVNALQRPFMTPGIPQVPAAPLGNPGKSKF